MLYFISDASKPVEYISCGNLASKDGFVHPKRNIDSFVLIDHCNKRDPAHYPKHDKL